MHHVVCFSCYSVKVKKQHNFHFIVNTAVLSQKIKTSYDVITACIFIQNQIDTFYFIKWKKIFHTNTKKKKLNCREKQNNGVQSYIRVLIAQVKHLKNINENNEFFFLESLAHYIKYAIIKTQLVSFFLFLFFFCFVCIFG